MSMLKEAFAAGKFGVTAEMAPPKGYDFSEQLEAAKLLNGKVFQPEGAKLRKSDRLFGYIHPCMAYPISDIEVLLT